MLWLKSFVPEGKITKLSNYRCTSSCERIVVISAAPGAERVKDEWFNNHTTITESLRLFFSPLHHRKKKLFFSPVLKNRAKKYICVTLLHNDDHFWINHTSPKYQNSAHSEARLSVSGSSWTARLCKQLLLTWSFRMQNKPSSGLWSSWLRLTLRRKRVYVFKAQRQALKFYLPHNHLKTFTFLLLLTQHGGVFFSSPGAEKQWQPLEAALYSFPTLKW